MSLLQRFTHRHTILTPPATPGGKWERRRVGCQEFDNYANGLQNRNFGLEDRDAASCKLMAGAFQLVLNLGDHFRNTLFGDDLSVLKLTSDGTAVKYEGPVYSVIIRPFQREEQIMLQPAPGLTVAPVTVSVKNGALGEDAQTMLLGGVERIRKVASGVADPVGDVQLVTSGSVNG